jgi:hypothetical protein
MPYIGFYIRLRISQQQKLGNLSLVSIIPNILNILAASPRGIIF